MNPTAGICAEPQVPRKARGKAFPRLVAGNFPCGRLAFQPDPENVHGRVDIAIMRSPAARTNPRSYSKSCDTYRPLRRQEAARRTGLGTISFTDIDIHGLPSGSFVPQHMSEGRPARIQDGLSHRGLCEFGRAYVTDDDKAVPTGNPSGLFVEMVATSVGDLGVDRADAALVSGALGDPEHGLVLAIMPKSGDLFAIAQRGKLLQAQVNADHPGTGREVVCDLAMEGHIPAPAGILHEGTALERACDLAGFPEAESALEVDDPVAINTDAPGNERHPPERPLPSETGAEARTFSVLVARANELAANLIGRVGMYAEIGGAAGNQIPQVNRGRPAAIAARNSARLGLSLCGDTEVPHLIAGYRVALQSLSARGILDAEFVGDDHEAGRLAGSAVVRSRGRAVVRYRAAPPYLAQIHKENNALASRRHAETPDHTPNTPRRPVLADGEE